VPLNSLKPEHDGKNVTIGGAVTSVREITTKNGQKMAFVALEDLFGETEIILFPSSYQQTTGIWERDRVVLARGKVNAKDRDGNIGTDIKILVNDAREITVAQAQAYQATGKKIKGPGARGAKSARVAAVKAASTVAEKPAIQRLYIRMQDSKDQDKLVSLKSAIDTYTGSMDVVLVLGDDSAKQIIKLPGGITNTEDAVKEVATLMGAENVKVH
jgi:DNA polymerase III alpha subunit